MSTAPEFVDGSPLVESACRFAIAAHGASPSRGAEDPEHSLAVASIVAGAGFGEEVVAAAVLHDVLERTPTTPEELRARFGDRVSYLVAAVTEDPSIEPYADRKAELRRRSRSSGPEAAAIAAADKLASVRRKVSGARDVPSATLEHYELTLEGLRRDHPALPWLDEIERQLGQLRAQVSRV